MGVSTFILVCVDSTRTVLEHHTPFHSYYCVVHVHCMYACPLCVGSCHETISFFRICSGVVIALVLSFTYICLLRWLAGVIIGVGIAACFILILASEWAITHHIVTVDLRKEFSHKISPPLAYTCIWLSSSVHCKRSLYSSVPVYTYMYTVHCKCLCLCRIHISGFS